LINEIDPHDSFVSAMLVLLLGTAGVLVSQMTELVLKKIGKHFGVDWLESKNDYLVLNDAGPDHRPDCETGLLTKRAAMGLDNYCAIVL
jgi:hypothetical protein